MILFMEFGTLWFHIFDLGVKMMDKENMQFVYVCDRETYIEMTASGI